MKRTNVLILAVLAGCFVTGCTAEEKQPEASGTVVLDIAGEELDLSGDFLYGQYGEVYVRHTTGFYRDNREHPGQFADGAFTGEYAGQEEWSRISRDTPAESYTFSTGYAQQQVSVQAGTAAPVQQSLMLEDVTLRGFLRCAGSTVNTGSAYGENETEGDLYFYPDPRTMGDFPFIDYGSGVNYPRVIAGEQSGFLCAADTQKILLGNLTAGEYHIRGLSDGEVAALFASSDLIEAEVCFRTLSMQYNQDAPTRYHSVVVETIRRLGDY